MEREKLALEAPTAQVRLLAEERLRDGREYSRRELIEYVTEQGRIMGLPLFREGHIAGGIREATINLQCEKVGRARFRACLTDSQPQTESCTDRAAAVCRGAWQQLTAIAREIDYISADEAQMQQLQALKECVMQIKSWEQRLEQL